MLDDDALLQVLFKLKNLYVCGWFNRHGRCFIAKYCEYSMSADVKLPYSFDYPRIGYNQNQSAGKATVTLAMLNAALELLHNASTQARPHTFKDSIAKVAIGLSEAMRFADVMVAIIKCQGSSRLNWGNSRPDIQVRSPA